MDKHLKDLYNVAMGGLIEKHSENKRFFTQKEFEENKAVIFKTTNAFSKLNDKLKVF